MPGEEVTWTVQIMNDGPSAAVNKAMVDVVPDGVRILSATKDAGEGPCSIDGQVVTCATARHEVGHLVTATIVGVLDPDFRGVLSNTATVSASTPDRSPDNNTSTAVATATPSVDLTLAKTQATPSPVIPGESATWTLTATNSGASTATSVTINDATPAGVSGATMATTAQGWVCSDTTCAEGSLAPGESVTFTVAGLVDAARTGDLVNTATITSTEADADPSDNTATSTTPTSPTTNLSVSKSLASPNPAIPGQPVSWTITVANAGPSVATGVALTDTLPTGVTGASISAPSGWTCTGTGTRRCTTPSMAPATSVTFTLTGTLAATITGDLVNTATLSSATTDSVPGDNSSTSTTPTLPTADLVLEKTLTSPTPVTPGEAVTWTFTLTNAGPSTSVSPSIRDTLPVGLSAVSTSASTPGWSCTLTPAAGTSGVIDCGAATLAPGAAATVTVSGSLDPSFSGTLANAASATASTEDPVPGNNTASATAEVIPSADLAVAKSLSGQTPVAGGPIQWTASVTNVGPSTAVEPVFTDDVPDDVSDLIVTPSDTEWNCTLAGQFLTCTGPDMLPDAPAVDIVIAGTLAADHVGEIANIGRVDSGTPDPDTGNNSDDATTNVGVESDLTLSKDLASGGTPGEEISWTLVVTNEGPSSARNPEVTDTLANVITGVSATPDAAAAAAGWSCTVAGQSVRCAAGTLFTGESATITVSGVLSAAATGTVSNTSRVSSESTDPIATNNTDTNVVTTVPSADLGITKTNASPDPVAPGERIGYRLQVHNFGPSVGRAVVVRDTLPAGLDAVTADINVSGWTCTVTGREVECAGAEMAVNEDVFITVTALLDPAVTTDLSNTATVESATPHPNTDNNISSVTTVVAPAVDLEVTKSVGNPNPAIAGQTVTWGVTTTNHGPSTATDLVLTDTLPDGVSLTAMSGDGWSCELATASCTLASLPPDASATVTVTGTVAADRTGVLTNTAAVVSATPEEHTEDNLADSDTPVASQADFALTKARTAPATGDLVAGEQVSWTLTAANTGPSAGVRPVITDVLPAAVSGVTASAPPGWSCAVASGRVTCTGPDTVPVGAEASIVLTGTVASSATGTLTNSASLTATTADPDPSDNAAGVTDAIAADARVSLTKSVEPATATVLAGQRVSFRLTTVNAGPSDARDLVLADTLVDGLTGLQLVSSAGWTCSAAATSLSCARPTLAAGASSSVVVSALVDANWLATRGEQLTNTATVTSTTPDSGGTADNTATLTADVIRRVDLQVGKSVGSPNPAVPGQDVTWTVTLTNRGPSTAYSVALTDTLPAGVSGGTITTAEPGWVCTDSTMTCTAEALAPGATVTATVTASVDADRLAPLVNSASAQSNLADTLPADNTASSSTPVAAAADLSVTKDLVNDPPVPGTRQQWVVTLANDGPSVAVNPRLSDTLIGTLSGNTATVDPGSTAAGFTCSVAELQIDCGAATMAPGTSVRVIIEGDLAPDVTGTLSNVAEVTSDTPDPDVTDNTARTDDVKLPEADLSVAKRVLSDEPLLAGTLVSWEVTSTNAGPSTAVSPVLTDAVPTPFIEIAARPTTAGWSCAVVGQDVSCTAPNLAPGATARVVVSALLPADAEPGSSVTNTAQVSSATLDADADDNTASVTSTVEASAELTISKSLATPNPVSPGEDVSWNVSVTNLGPAVATGVTSTDEVPAEVTGVAVSTTSPAWSSCSVAGQLVTCDGATLAPGASLTYVISGTLDPSFAGALTNTARVTADTPDPGALPNDATSTTVADAEVGLTVTKVADRAAAIAGGPISWTLTLTNDGPAAALTPVLVDTPDGTVALAPGAAVVTSAPDPASWTCVVDDSVTCDADVLLPGESVTVTVTGTIAADAVGVVENVVVGSAADAEGDVVEARASTSTPVGQEADLRVAKTPAATAFIPGEPATWDVVVTNDGPSEATAVSLDDALPVGLTVVRATSSDPEVSCSVSDVVGCTRGVLPAGASFTVSVTGTIDPGVTGNLVNTATVSSTTADTDPANDTATASTPLEPRANVAIDKTEISGTVVPGEAVAWQLTLTNAGPSTATDLVVTDTPPAVVGDLTATADTPDWGCTIAAGTITCSGADLPPGVTATITIGGTLLDPFHVGVLSNTATVTTATDEDDLSDNSDTATSETYPAADVTIDKIAPATVVPGEEVTWTVVALNNGPSAARDIAITDPVSDLVTLTGASGAGWDCSISGQEVACTGPELAPAATASVTITGILDPSAIGQLDNAATISTSTPGDDPANNTDATRSTITPRADLALSKSSPQSAAVPGDTVTWTMDVTNAGPSVASGVVLRDTVPAAVTGLTLVETPDGWACGLSGNDVTCGSDAFDVGTVTVTLSGTLASDFADTTLVNTATLSATTLDPDVEDLTSTATLPVAPDSDVSLTKSVASPNPAVPGSPVEWNLTVVNAGPSQATGLVVTDNLPTSLLTPTAIAGASGWACTVAGQQVTCLADTLAVGSAVTITVSGTLDPSILGPVTNSASVTADADANPDNNSATSSTPTLPTSDLAISKENVDLVFVPGLRARWRVTVTNNGPSTLVDPTWSDDFAEGLSNGAVESDPDGPGAAGWSCTGEGSTSLACSAPTMGPGTSASFLVSGELASSYVGSVANAVVATSATFDPNLGNNASATSTATSGLVDVAIEKSDPTPNPPIAGDPVTWTLTVTNAGPSDAWNTHVVDTLPAGIADVTATPADTGWVCTVEGGQAICDGEVLAAGAHTTIAVRGVLASDLTSSITNTATVSTTVEDDDPDNNTDSVTSPTRSLADLAIAKARTSASPPIPGEPVEWTLTVTNNGASVARDIVMADTVPTVVGGVQVTTAAADLACQVDGQQVTCAAASLAVGASMSVTVSGVLDPGVTADLTNTASVDSATTDDVTDNNVATATDAVRPTTALSLTKSQTMPNPAIAGNPVEWALTVVNAGPSTATGLTLDDAVVSDVELVGVRTAAPGWVCEASGQDVHCDAATLDVGASVTVFVTGVVRSDLTGTLPNTAVLGHGTYDPDTTDNTATSESPVAQQADLSVTKSAPTPEVPVPGSAVSWDVIVQNAGPSIAFNALVADRVPDGVTDVTVTPGPDAGAWDCGIADQEITCTAAEVPSGSTATLTISGVLAPDFAGDLVNSANVTSDTFDLDPTNNTGVSRATTRPSADLRLEKSGPVTARAGETITWTVTVTNDGPSTALNPRVIDLPPLTDITRVAATVDDPSWSCELTNTGPDCVGAFLAPDQSVTITVTALIDADYVGDFRQLASVTDSTEDPDPTNNSAWVDTTVVAVADQGVTKTLLTEPPVVPGGEVSWLIRVVNLGPSFARDSVISDEIPAGVTDVQVETTAAFGSCTLDAASLSCAIPQQPVGDANAVEITVTGTLASSHVGDLSNTAVLTSSTPDPSTGNDTSTVTVPTTPQPDLALTVSEGQPSPAVAGGTVAWDLTLRNIGPSDATDVSLEATIPAGVSALGALDVPDGWTWTAEPATDGSGATVLRFVGPRIAAGEVLGFRVSGVVDADATGTLVVAATAATGTDEPVLSNNTDTSSTPIVSSGGLEVLKTASAVVADGAGSVVEYTIGVTNPGPSTVTGIAVADALTSGVELTVACPATVLAATESMTCTTEPYTLTQADVDAGGVVNGATASGTLPDGAPVVGADSATVSVDLVPGLTLSKSGRYIDRGAAGGTTDDTITWTFTITNPGNTTLRDVAISDPLLAGVSLPVASLAPGQSVTATATSSVASAWIRAGEVRNDATASAGSAGPCRVPAGAPGAAAGQALVAVLTCRTVVTADAATTVAVPPAPTPPATPTTPPSPPRLPQTGTNTGLTAVAAGLALVLLGGLLLGWRRRTTVDKE